LPVFPLQGLLAEESKRTGLPDRYWLGAAYYPELTPHADWGTDFDRMHTLGINVVRMAEFAWSRMEPAEGRFDFAWLDEALGLAQERGIAVLLGTPTASVPPWLYRAHPDVLGGNEHGAYTYGGRKGFALYSPAMRAAAQRVVHAMAARYASHPAVKGWQLSNEAGFPFTDYDPDALTAFRAWLRARYGTLDALNDAWDGLFWSNTYDAWDEIQLPVNQPEAGFYAAVRLDYRRFFSDSYVDWLRMEATTLRSAGAKQMAFVNWPETTWSVDIRATAPFLDAAAWDNYGLMADDRDLHTQFYSAMNHDLCRCSRTDRRFFVAEQRSEPPASSSPAAVRLQTFADFAYGAFGTVYFEWRPPLSGAERGYASILERDGSFGASIDQIRKVRAEFDALWPRLRDATTVAKVAMIFSYDDQWDRGFAATEGDAKLYSYSANFARFYAGAKALHANIDIVSPDASLDAYALVIAPGLQMVSDSVAASLSAFVRRGGCLVLDQGTGTRDASGHDRAQKGPGPLQQIAGLSVNAASRVDGPVPGYALQLAGESKTYAALHDIESVTLHGATEVARLMRPDESTLTAVTKHTAGPGCVFYFAAGSSDPGFYEAMMHRIGEQARITPLIEVPAGVDVVSRTADGTEYIFLMNLTPTPQKISLPHRYRDAATNASVADAVTLEAFDVRVLATES